MLHEHGYIHLFELEFLFPSAKYQEMKSLDYMLVILNFLRDGHTVFPYWPHQYTFLPTVNEYPHFSTSSELLISCLFYNNHSDRCDILIHSLWYWLAFPWYSAPFHIFVGQLYVFFGKMSVQVLWPLFNQIFFLLSCMSSLYTLDISSFLNLRFLLSFPQFLEAKGLTCTCPLHFPQRLKF